MIKKITKYFLFSLCSIVFFCGISFAQLSWNQAGKFNAPNSISYLSVANASEFNNINEIMLETWVCFNVNPGGQYIFIDKGNANYRIAYSFNQLYLRTDNTLSGTPDLAQNISLSANRWYHIAAIVRDTIDLQYQIAKSRELYLDGALLKRDIQGFKTATLGTSTDSLFIGGFGAPNFGHAMRGYLDDIRIWVGKYYAEDITRNFRTSLSAWGNSNNYYYKCILSLPFQDGDNLSSPFTTADNSRYGHSVINHNVTAFSLGSGPSVTSSDNLSVHLNGSTDYLAAPDHINNSPDVQMTLEAWVYPEKTYTGGFSDFGTIICKGFSNYNYRLFLGSGNSVAVTINGNSSFGYTGDVSAPANRWTHIAFTYNNSGVYSYYINGVLSGSGTNNAGSVTNGTDSLYIGQSNGGSFFQGYVDEVKISAYEKTQAQVNEFLNRAMDLSDRPSVFDLTCYNFDGSLANNNGPLPRLYFRNGAVFSSLHVPGTKNFPVSPLIKLDNYNFPAAWYLSNNNFRIPMIGTSGSSKYDTINIPYCMGIGDVNVFLALNHTFEKDLTVYLISPSGDSVEMVKTNVMKRGQYVTVFNDEADSSIVNDRYTSFLPMVKPVTSIKQSFFNKNAKGDWKLRVTDSFGGDTGMVYSWGFQLNGMTSKPSLMTSGITANPGGFWTGSSQPADTVRYILHRSTAPYDAVDSAIGYVNQFGFATTYLANALNGSYYIEIRHRNSLAVWSSTARAFTKGGSTGFNILAGGSTVYGGELISINGRWCMYSGDINQDGAINGNDFTILNQQFGLSGYLASDLNGDNTVNGNDFTILNSGYGKQTNHP